MAEAPCIDVPPDRAILVFAEAGEDVREEVVLLRTLGRSEIRDPAAEGGGLGDAFRDAGLEVDVVGLGS